MEERKRPAANDHDESAPPLKKHAININGTSKPHVDADMPWKDDLERFQKDAILRQLQEHKRERNSIEARLNAIEQRSRYHDDHIMIIDAWFSELLDEVRIMAGDMDNHETFQPFPSALLISDADTFRNHLQSKSLEISTALSKVFARSTGSPEVADLQARLSQSLTLDKAHLVELEQCRLEKEQLDERLEDAFLRYMLAEKKLDRSKSTTVAKLEKQALAGGRSESGSGLGGQNNADISNQKDIGPSSSELLEAEMAMKEAVAESNKRKAQIDALEVENEKINTQLTSCNSRLAQLSDEDYSKTDLFKQIKGQYGDVIKRVNDLEATNIQLREEAEKLHAERTAYRVQVEQESVAAVAERDRQLAQAEHDLVRIRTTRDELTADLQMRRAAQNQERISADQIKELASAKEERIKALELELERLQMQGGQQHTAPVSPPASLDGLSADEMQTKYVALEKQHSLLNTELQSMGTAFNKASRIASQKVASLSSLEDKIQRLAAEKSKADQKYFAAMKAKEARETEVRTLRAQNAKSSEMVTSLKDTETANRALQIVSEKQIAEAKESILNISAKLRLEQQALSERNMQLDNLKTQAETLTKQLSSKDEANSAHSTAHRKAEVEIESLRVRVEETKKGLNEWKTKAQGNSSDQEETLRHLAICAVCRRNFKDTALKTCGHLFCKECVDERTASRSRKCPNCNKSFGAGDVMRVTL